MPPIDFVKGGGGKKFEGGLLAILRCVSKLSGFRGDLLVCEGLNFPGGFGFKKKEKPSSGIG